MGGSMISDFVVGSNGHCFFCLNQIMELKHPQNLSLPLARATNSLQYLTRYLKMDMRKAFIEKGQVSPELLDKFGKTRLKVELCEECRCLSEGFSNAYRQLEKLELELGSTLGLIYEKLAKVDATDKLSSLTSSIESNWNGLLLQVLGVLRAEAIQKSSHKLSDLPRVRIRHLTMMDLQAKQPLAQNDIQSSHLENRGLDTIGVKMKSPNEDGLTDNENGHYVAENADFNQDGEIMNDYVEIERDLNEDDNITCTKMTSDKISDSDMDIDIEFTTVKIEYDSTNLIPDGAGNDDNVDSLDLCWSHNSDESAIPAVNECELAGDIQDSQVLVASAPGNGKPKTQIVQTRTTLKNGRRVSANEKANTLGSPDYEVERQIQATKALPYHVHRGVMNDPKNETTATSATTKMKISTQIPSIWKTVAPVVLDKHPKAGKPKRWARHALDNDANCTIVIPPESDQVEEPPPSVNTTSGNYKCNICGQEFSRTQYIRHFRSVHMGIKFQCNFCQRNFNDKSNLKKHQRKDGAIEKRLLKS